MFEAAGLTCDFSLMVKHDAAIASHNVYRSIAIGGVLTDLTPGASAVIGGGTFSYVNSLPAAHRFNFNGGVITGQGLPLDWTHFKYLATTLQTYKAGGVEIHVVCSPGTYDFGDFCRDCPNGHDSPGGRNFLIVFNTAGTVTLTGTADNRQWFGSVLAPDTDLVVDGSIGFIDGFIIAKSFRETGPSAGGLQIHGNCYEGPMSMSCGVSRNCVGGEFSSSSHSDLTCSARVDRLPSKKCDRKFRKNKCTKRKTQRKCSFTCAGCVRG